MASPAVKKPKPKTLVEVLASPIVVAVEKALQDMYKEFPGAPASPLTGKSMHLSACDAIAEAVDVFLNGKVLDAHIIMYDKTPMIRVDIRHRGKVHKINKSEPLRHLIARFWNGSPLTEHVAKHLLSLLPQDQVALQVASIENAAAAALQDPKKLGPIRERLNLKRMADKERLMARIRDAFKDHDDLLSEAEVLQMWHETFCREVMDS